MFKVVLFCGGSGGKALQGGFASLFGYGNYKLDAVINAYDNGKSTGVCRRIFDDDILGPSDLRKNQLTQFKLKYKDQLKDKDSKEFKLYELFELRFDGTDYQDYHDKALKLINDIDYLEKDKIELFRKWLDYFFSKDVKDVNFRDFSLSNIFYASCAALNNNSLEKAGMIMSDVLGIEDRVHVISNVNLYLYNLTQSGHLITDEGDLVTWNNPDDKVVEAILRDKNGNDYLPSVNEKNEKDIEKLVEEADLIIFSSGTQWSSLIPSYMHKGFREMLSRSKARKYLVMNNKEDLDSKGVCADDLLRIISRYLDLSDVKAVINDNADASMNHVSDDFKYIHGVLSEKDDPKHDPVSVVRLIMMDYFDLKGNDYQLVSDLDGTLYDEHMEDKTICLRNMELFKGVILSGNNYKHVYDIVKQYYRKYSGEYIYCNYGNTYFNLEKEDGGQILSNEFLVKQELIDELGTYPEYKDKMTLRGGAILTIKPLKDRENEIKKIEKIIEKYGDEYKAEIAGHTSIDIMKKDFSKEKTFELIIKKENLDKDRIIYLGNELDGGNDEAILNTKVRTINFDGPVDTYIFLKTYYE